MKAVDVYLDARGFTFFGMIILIMAMGMAAAVLVAAVGPIESKDRVKITFARADVLELALKKYKAENNNVAPAQLSVLVSGNGVPCTVDINPVSANYKKLIGWCGPYIDQPVAGNPNEYQTDGWDTIFQYTGALIRSCGPDRTCNNADDLTFTNF